jgi:hypothetical protein
MAEADSVGANAKAQAANPINKSRFMSSPPWIRVIATGKKVPGASEVPFGCTGNWPIRKMQSRHTFPARPLRVADEIMKNCR